MSFLPDSFHIRAHMSKPTVLSPWYVVQRMDKDCFIEYYQSQEEDDNAFTKTKKQALLFASLGSAARVAEAEVAEVRVLTTAEEAKEFGRS